MQINENTVALVKEYEGLVLTAYPDPGTKNDVVKKGRPWTIGYGHTGLMSLPLVKEGDRITQEQAEEYLRSDLNVAAARVAALVKVELNDNQFGAIVSFYENLGEATFVKSSVLKNINTNKLDTIPGRLALYRLANGKVLEGLVRRRAAEGSLWLQPVSTVVPSVTVEVNHSAGQIVQPDQNAKKKWDWGAVGGMATVVAVTSNDVKTAIGNVTSAFNIPPTWLLIAIGVGFAGWTLYNKVKKDR